MRDRQELGGGVSQWGYFEKQLCICVPKGMTVESEEEQTTFRVALVTVRGAGDHVMSLVFSKGEVHVFGVKHTGTKINVTFFN